ncbi:MAG: hypothetical protein N2A42_03840 [Luteolibacter sp.]
MPSILITCPNATCAIPEAHRELFKGSEDLVSSTEGWEPGSLNLAQGLAMKFSTPLIHGEVTRLLIDLEQDGNKRWSKISSKLPEATRIKLVNRQQDKFRNTIEARLNEDFKRHDSVIHLDIHTAPIADGKIIMEHIASPLAQKIADNTVKLLPSNEVDSSSLPLMDKTPFNRWLLESFPSEKYGFIRITISQSFFMRSIPMRWETIKKSLIQALVSTSK